MIFALRSGGGVSCFLVVFVWGGRNTIGFSGVVLDETANCVGMLCVDRST